VRPYRSARRVEHPPKPTGILSDFRLEANLSQRSKAVLDCSALCVSHPPYMGERVFHAATYYMMESKSNSLSSSSRAEDACEIQSIQ